MNKWTFYLGLLVALFGIWSPETNALLDIFTLTPGVALGGLITGIIASTLGGISIAIAFEKLEFVDAAPDEPTYGGYGGGYGGGNYRRKRDTGNDFERLKAEKLRVEEFMDDIYENDQSQCIEKLICDISKRSADGSSISDDEKDILKVVERNRSHGQTYKKMLMAAKVASVGGDCEFLFDSCPLETSLMIQYVGNIAKKVIEKQS